MMTPSLTCNTLNEHVSGSRTDAQQAHEHGVSAPPYAAFLKHTSSQSRAIIGPSYITDPMNLPRFQRAPFSTLYASS